MIFSVCCFPTNMKLAFCQKSKDDFFPKNTPKDDISALLKKMIFILEKVILAFSVPLWRPFQMYSYIAFQ